VKGEQWIWEALTSGCTEGLVAISPLQSSVSRWRIGYGVWVEKAELLAPADAARSVASYRRVLQANSHSHELPAKSR
jgi:hypothetical protein